MSATVAIIAARDTSAGPSALAVALATVCVLGDVACGADTDDPPCLVVFPAVTKAGEDRHHHQSRPYHAQGGATEEAVGRRFEVVEYDPNPPFC